MGDFHGTEFHEFGSLQGQVKLENPTRLAVLRQFAACCVFTTFPEKTATFSFFFFFTCHQTGVGSDEVRWGGEGGPARHLK